MFFNAKLSIDNVCLFHKFTPISICVVCVCLGVLLHMLCACDVKRPIFCCYCLRALKAMAAEVLVLCGAACLGVAFHLLRTMIFIHDLDVVFHMGRALVHLERSRDM